MKLHEALRQKWILAAIAVMSASTLQAQREMKTINDSWEFRKPTETEWKMVNLPHTYNLDAYQQPNYYQGKGVYRRTLTLPEVIPHRRYYLKIDAASKAAEVRVNGKEIGSHAGGYTAFIFDITPYIQKENVIEITVDNSRKDITPISADFTFWGGIYRDVWLISTPEQHFRMDNMGSDGIFVNTPEVNEKYAKGRLRGEVTNDAHDNATLMVRNMLFDPTGKPLQTREQKLRLKAGETRGFDDTFGKIAEPMLWSPENPQLYTIRTVLINPETNEVLDEKTTTWDCAGFPLTETRVSASTGNPTSCAE